MQLLGAFECIAMQINLIYQQNSIKLLHMFLNVKFASPNKMDSCEARENLLVRRGLVVVMSLRLFPKKKNITLFAAADVLLWSCGEASERAERSMR
jgi:hypothetical protein